MSNTQDKLGKVRAPRVQITYDVENGGASEKKELPLVLGVIGDFSHQDTALRDRSFVHIDKDNFDDVMVGMQPKLDLLVESSIPDREGQLAISLKFNTMDDFSPENIALQIEPLRNLLDMRAELNELRNRTSSNEALKEQLVNLISSQNKDDGVVEQSK